MHIATESLCNLFVTVHHILVLQLYTVHVLLRSLLLHVLLCIRMYIASLLQYMCIDP